MHSTFFENIKKIAFQILILGGIWIIVPLVFNDFNFNPHLLKKGIASLIGVSIIVILNVCWLLPNFYFKNKIGIYILFCLLILLLIGSCAQIIGFYGPAGRRRPIAQWFRVLLEMYQILPYVLAFVGSALFEISSFASKKVKETMELQNEKLATEMKLLKSQINPHFLFNALNNIYSLSILKPKQTPQNLLKLSDMLRYVLYECNTPKVVLSKEITYLKNFIGLKLLKDSRGMKITTNLNEVDSNLQIAPMLLIPFVENAFKHGNIEDLENGWININLKTEGSLLTFKVENSCQNKNFTKDKTNGIGLNNLKRQLTLLYPKKHQVKINESGNLFSAYLEIYLV